MSNHIPSGANKERKPCIKFIYKTLEDANKKIHALELINGRKVNAYKCPYCHFYHLTAQKQKINENNNQRRQSH